MYRERAQSVEYASNVGQLSHFVFQWRGKTLPCPLPPPPSFISTPRSNQIGSSRSVTEIEGDSFKVAFTLLPTSLPVSTKLSHIHIANTWMSHKRNQSNNCVCETQKAKKIPTVFLWHVPDVMYVSDENFKSPATNFQFLIYHGFNHLNDSYTCGGIRVNFFSLLTFTLSKGTKIFVTIWLSQFYRQNRYLNLWPDISNNFSITFRSARIKTL